MTTQAQASVRERYDALFDSLSLDRQFAEVKALMQWFNTGTAPAPTAAVPLLHIEEHLLELHSLAVASGLDQLVSVVEKGMVAILGEEGGAA